MNTVSNTQWGKYQSQSESFHFYSVNAFTRICTTHHLKSIVCSWYLDPRIWWMLIDYYRQNILTCSSITHIGIYNWKRDEWEESIKSGCYRVSQNLALNTNSYYCFNFELFQFSPRKIFKEGPDLKTFSFKVYWRTELIVENDPTTLALFAQFFSRHPDSRTI